MNNKQQIRLELRQRRRSLLSDEIRARSLRISSTLFLSDEYKNAAAVLIFISTQIEVDTSFIIEQAFNDNKVIAAPRCHKDNNVMSFYEICSYDDLEVGAFNIREPREKCKPFTDFKNSLCVVPGLGYDLNGNRIGFGRGYYDRFLEHYDGISAGVCFDDFVYDTLPHDNTDIRVDMIATESRLIRTGL